MVKMSQSLTEFRSESQNSEKITINLGFIDLGQIDLLVQEAFYANRTDFIRTAIRNQLDRHQDSLRQATARHELQLGLATLTRDSLEALRTKGEMLNLKILGLAVIAPDVTPDLALATIASLKILGALQAAPDVKAALRPRIR
jgi:Arc/MetJ-type ribon-helix-helix transcriptional regulator